MKLIEIIIFLVIFMLFVTLFFAITSQVQGYKSESLNYIKMTREVLIQHSVLIEGEK